MTLHKDFEDIVGTYIKMLLSTNMLTESCLFVTAARHKIVLI